MKFELVDLGPENAVIKVFGVGGCGGNAVNHMLVNEIEGIEFICANTDVQALRQLEVGVGTVIQLGIELTKGLGAGTNPEVGREAAEESQNIIREALEGTNMLFLTAGMGGGTGTGAIQVIAKIAKELNILTVGVVTKPFDAEGAKKKQAAEDGIAELKQHVDSLIIIPNQKLLSDKVSMSQALGAANDVLLDAVRGISELITKPGFINLDFSDVKTVMLNMGTAIMGTGVASGENRARVAVEKAISCPLLEDINLQGARGILVNISATDMGISEFEEVGNILQDFASDEATIKIGMTIDASLGDDIKVTVVVTGMEGSQNVVNNTIRITPSAAISGTDYSGYDAAPQTRKASETKETRFGVHAKNNSTDMEYLDTPAFLRRQAD